MGLSGRILTLLMTFFLVAGVLVASWLFWGKTLENTEHVTARLLEDTIKLAVEDARNHLARIVGNGEDLKQQCEANPEVDFCLEWDAASSQAATDGVFLRESLLGEGPDAQVREQFLLNLREQLGRHTLAGAGIVYWQQQPLWIEFAFKEGHFRGAGFVVTRLLDRWSRSTRLEMVWRWRLPQEEAIPWGMAEVRLPAVSGAPIALLANASALAPPVLTSWFGLNVMAAAAVLLLLVWALFYRPIWRRLDQLVRQLRTILAERNYSARVRLTGKDEVSEIAQHCNGLLSAIEYSHNLMAKTNLVTSELLHKLDKTTMVGVGGDWQDGKDALSDSMALATRISGAIETQQLVMHYQPVISMDSGAVVAWEALCRWQTPDGSVLLPAEFLPVAEQSGQMQGLLKWSLHAVARDLTLLPGSYPRVSINLSHAQLMDPQLVPLLGAALLDQPPLDAERLDFEIKETSLLRDFEGVTRQIGRLRELGVGVTVDGYGFGAHSLTYLQRCPVTRLKLSRVFSERIASEYREIAFIEGITRFAAGLGVAVVATHIETDFQLKALQGTRGIAAQGYSIARPMAIAEAQVWRWQAPGA